MATNVIVRGDEESAPKKNAARRILETARELFYQRGIRAVGVDEIVSQAGVTKPSLYRAFESKDALVAACLELCAEERREGLKQFFADAPDDPRARLRLLIRLYADELGSADFRGCPMSNTAVEFPEPDHPARVVAKRCKSEMRDMLGDLTRELGVRDPEALADGLLLIVEGAWTTYQTFGSKGPAAALAATGDALIDGYMAAVEA